MRPTTKKKIENRVKLVWKGENHYMIYEGWSKSSRTSAITL